jgi:hypothetical protein
MEGEVWRLGGEEEEEEGKDRMSLRSSERWEVDSGVVWRGGGS